MRVEFHCWDSLESPSDLDRNDESERGFSMHWKQTCSCSSRLLFLHLLPVITKELLHHLSFPDERRLWIAQDLQG